MHHHIHMYHTWPSVSPKKKKIPTFKYNTDSHAQHLRLHELDCHTTSIGTNTACDKIDDAMPATPFAMAAWVVSDRLNGSSIRKEATFVVSKAVRNIILAGTAPVMTVPNPLYKPGMPSVLSNPLMTENALLSNVSFEATCIRVFTTETG